MTLSEYIDALASITPDGWDFLYAIPEMIYHYDGGFPLVFAQASPSRITFPAEASIMRIYTQKISFMYLDKQDSLGLKLKTSGLNEMIQVDDLVTTQNVVNNFCLALREYEGLNIRSIQETPMPRYLVNGGKVLLGYDLTFEIETMPIKCITN